MSEFNCSVDTDTLDLLINGLGQLRGNCEKQEGWKVVKGNKGSGCSKQPNVLTIDNTDINAVLNQLLITVNLIFQNTNDLKIANAKLDSEVTVLKSKVRENDDDCDETKQRGLKGNLILVSSPSHNKSSLIKPMDCLDAEGTSLLDHVTDLIKLKFGVILPHTDIQACHHLPNNKIILRIWNRVPGSAWSKLIDEIKKGSNPSINFYANFQLTTRRNSLLHQLRCLKRDQKIAKLYSTENGSLFFKLRTEDNKTKITFASKGKEDVPRTLTLEELNKLILG
jgi:hypothetical protein